MTGDTAASLGRWRDGGPSRSGPSRHRIATVKWFGATLLSILLVVAAGTVVWIIWQFMNLEKSRSEFVGFFVSDYQRPRVPNNPWTRLDRDALRHMKLFNQVDASEHAGKAMTREIMGVRLESLAQRKPQSVAVVYLSCRAMVDAAGTIQLLGADADPFAPNTLLPLHDALAAIKNYPAENKLLVLDIIWSALNALDLGGTTDGVADLIRKELGREDDPSKLDDPHLMVLAACSPGEVALWSERLGQSVFGHYFLSAFHDPEADTDHDQAIWVKELASYVSTKVDEWARQHRGLRQRPVLIGTAKDFRLATLEPQKAVSRPKNALAETAGDNDKVLEQEKAPDKHKDDEKAKAPGTNKAEGKEPATAKGSDKDTEKPVGPQGRVYPQWLAGGWKLYEQWANGAEVTAAPRVFRCLETSLLRWEQEWRSGLEPREIQARFDQSLSELYKEMEQALQSAPRVARSVGQARAFGQRPDPALVKGLKELLERRRKPEPLAPPDQVKTQLDSALKSFLATLKGKTRLDLAMAMVETAGDERFDPATVKFLDSLVVDTLSGLDVVELRLLRQLARRAGTTRPDVWDDETAKTAWVTVVVAEEANNRPYALPWIRESLDDADALRHEAEVLLLPEAAGFASRDQISQTWQRVQEAYAYIDSFQMKIRDARLMLNRARVALPPMIPYLEVTGRAEREALWLQAAQTAHQLDVLLERPATPTRERLEPLGIGLSDTTQKLDSELKSLLQPFETGAVRDLVRRCGMNQPRPGVAGEVEAILTTPFPPFSERIRLWEASLVLDDRLGELSVPAPESTSGAAHLAARTEAARDVAARRARRISTLLGLAGAEAVDQPGGASEPATEPHTPSRSSDTDSASHLATLSRMWGGLARVSRLVLAKLVDLATQTNRTDDEDRPGWIAPAFVLELRPNPIRQGRDRDELAVWRWLAGHYRHRDLDLHRLVDPDKFYDTAALEYPDVDRTSPENALELGMAQGSPGGLTLSGHHSGTQAAIRLLLRGTEDAAPQSVSLKVLEPADPRLRVPEPPPSEVKLQPQTPRPVSFGIKWEEDRTDQEGPPPAGLIVQARLPNQRPYHLLVPLTIVSDSTRPRLVLRADPAKHDDVPFDRLLLRTLPVRQNLFLFVKNPSPMTREVVVEVVADTVVIVRTPKAIPVKGNSTVLVPGFGDPVLKPPDPLPEVPQGLKLRLRDSAAGQILDEQPLQPVIAAPLEYLEVIQPRFIPTRPGEPNRLEMTLRALPQMTGPACRVKLIVPSDKDLFPAFREVPKGHLEGILEPGDKSLPLYAEDIKLDPAAKEEGRFQVTIDGLQRALWYKTRFPAEGEPQPATIDRTPRVRFQPEVVLKEGQPAKLRVQFAVDNAPPNVRLAFVLGQYKNGKWVDDLTPWVAGAKRRHLGFGPQGEGGALQFEASVEDWTKEFDIPQIRGQRRLQAYLLDPQGRRDPLDSWGMDLVLDDLPPREMGLVVPAQVEKGTTTLAVGASVKPPPSGIKEVAFIWGSKADFAKAEADGKSLAGKPKGDDQRDWEATLTLPKDAAGKLVVTARFTSGVGLVEFVSADVVVREPPPSPPAAAEEAASQKPGGIEGKVTENDVAQPGLVVYLIDPNAKDKENPVKDQKKTNADGTYSFLELKPGRYTLVCEKDATRRRATKDVTIPSGKTVRQDLDLLLP